MEEREISRAVIRRLPRYYRYLGELLENGVERISSNDLSKRMKVQHPRSVRILIISEDSDNRDTVIMLSIYTQRLERY